jgi:hypothetical protein
LGQLCKIFCWNNFSYTPKATVPFQSLSHHITSSPVSLILHIRNDGRGVHSTGSITDRGNLKNMEKNLLLSNLIHVRSTDGHGFESESPWYENWHLTIALHTIAMNTRIKYPGQELN